MGNLQDYEADRLAFLLATRAEYGGVVAFDRRTTMIHDGDLVEEVLKDRDRHFVVRENFLQEEFTAEDFILATRLGRHLNPGLRPAALGQMPRIVNREVVTALGSPQVASGSAVDPLPLMEGAISRAVARLYFGDAGGEVPERAGSLLDALAQIIGNPLAPPPNRCSPARRRVHRRHRELLRVVQPLLLADDADVGRESSFARSVVRAAQGEASMERITRTIIGSLLASQRVPAAGACWLLMVLADHPRLMGSLRDEARQFHRAVATTGAAVTVEQFPGALAVVLETLRLYPPTWLITRVANSAVDIGGYRFDAGHNFMISPYVLHRDPAGYADPGEFRPDRWSGRRATAPYLPFGRGQHACPGRNLALLTLVSLLLTVVHAWTCTRPALPVRPNPRTTLLPDGLAVAFQPLPHGRQSPAAA